MLDLSDSAPALGAETGQHDAFGPSPGYNRYYVDVTSALSLLAELRKRHRELKAVAARGMPFITVRQLLSGGEETLGFVQDLIEEIRRLHAKGDDDIAAPALVPEGQARLRTPVPDSPLYLVCHSNNPMPWRKQIKGDAARHIAQIPSVRIRTVNSLIGQNETLCLPMGFLLSMGTEFGFVIGAEARSVKAEDALHHIAGYVCTNDCYSGMFSGSMDFKNAPYALTSNVQTADKCTDGCSPFDRLLADRSVFGHESKLSLAGLPAPSSFWMLIGNQSDSVKYEPENIHSDVCPVPMPMPAGSLATAASDGGVMRIDLPPGEGRIKAVCQLAIIVGPDSVYQATAAKAKECVTGHAVLLSIHDSGPLDSMELPVTVYERRWALFLGYLGDRRHVLGPARTGTPAGMSAIRLTAGGSEQISSPSWYEYDGADAIAHLSKAVTLLPGDVICLGPLGKWVTLPAEELTGGVNAGIACDERPYLDVMISRRAISMI